MMRSLTDDLQGLRCRRKVAYANKERAEAALIRMIQSGAARIGDLRVYECPYGAHFHLGGVRQPKGRKKKNRT